MKTLLLFSLLVSATTTFAQVTEGEGPGNVMPNGERMIGCFHNTSFDGKVPSKTFSRFFWHGVPTLMIFDAYSVYKRRSDFGNLRLLKEDNLTQTFGGEIYQDGMRADKFEITIEKSVFSKGKGKAFYKTEFYVKDDPATEIQCEEK